VGLSACILAIGFIGGLSYHYLHQIETKQRFVEIADDLSNNHPGNPGGMRKLSALRFAEDLQENRRYIKTGPGNPWTRSPRGEERLKIASQFPRFQKIPGLRPRVIEELPQEAPGPLGWE